MAQQTAPALTKEELKTLMKETIREAMREMLAELVAEIVTPQLDALAARLEDKMEGLIFELEQALPDPDEGKEFTPEFAESLRQGLKDKSRGIPLEQVKRELGLDD
jgi:hypothetical protein